MVEYLMIGELITVEYLIVISVKLEGGFLFITIAFFG